MKPCKVKKVEKDKTDASEKRNHLVVEWLLVAKDFFETLLPSLS